MHHTLKHSSFSLSTKGSPLGPFPFLVTPPILFGTIGGIAGALCLYAIVYWSLFGCVCCLRRRCRKSSPIDPADSYSPNEGGSVRCNSDALYGPAFGVSGVAWHNREGCTDGSLLLSARNCAFFM